MTIKFPGHYQLSHGVGAAENSIMPPDEALGITSRSTWTFEKSDELSDKWIKGMP